MVEALERVDRLRRWLVDVDQPLVGANLEVLARVLVLERTADHAVDVLLSRQRDRARHGRARARGGVDDLLRRGLDGRVVIGLQPDPDLVLRECCHFGLAEAEAWPDVLRAGPGDPPSSVLVACATRRSR